MTPPARRLLTLGTCLALVGSVGAITGGRRLWTFFVKPPEPPWTLAMFAKLVIVPHVLLILGCGMLIFGAILVMKSAFVEKRIRAEASQRKSKT